MVQINDLLTATALQLGHEETRPVDALIEILDCLSADDLWTWRESRSIHAFIVTGSKAPMCNQPT